MKVITALIVILSGLSSGHRSDRRSSSPEIRTFKLTDKLYVLEGAGGNVAVFVWDDGVLLVDDKIAPATAQSEGRCRRDHAKADSLRGEHALASGSPRRQCRTGGRWRESSSRTRTVRRRLSVDGFVEVFARKHPAPPPQALPIVTFTRDVTFHLGGEEISIVHVERAHTDGDSFVRFRTANALHMGDCYLNGSYPVIDYSNGGTLHRHHCRSRHGTRDGRQRYPHHSGARPCVERSRVARVARHAGDDSWRA